MRPTRILAATASATRLFTVATVLPAIVAYFMEPRDVSFGIDLPRNSLVFLTASLVLCLFWMPVLHYTRAIREEELRDKETYLTIPLTWLLLTAFAGIPFIVAGLLGPIDAFFEAMSGTTTTGSTVIKDIEAVAPSLLFWRAALQYMGGMVIIVLGVALLGRLTQGTGQLLHAERHGISRARPKLLQTALSLWGIYLIASAIALICYTAVLRFDVGLPLATAFWDGLLTTMTSLSTGGFSHKAASIGHYQSGLLELFVIIFMLYAAGNFSLHYHAVHGGWKQTFRDAEWRYFIGGLFVATLATSGLLLRAGVGLAGSLRESAFTVTSIATSTGFTNNDYDAWPETAKLLLVVAMLTGATAGSTSGGLKVVRIALLIKVVNRELKKLQHPRAIIPIRMGNRVIKEETLTTVVAFFFAFIGLWLVGATVLVATDHIGMVDGAVAAASAIGNTGPALGALGPGDTHADLLPSSKMILSFLMWAGRLEMFTALVLFAPSSWRS